MGYYRKISSYPNFMNYIQYFFKFNISLKFNKNVFLIINSQLILMNSSKTKKFAIDVVL